MKKSVNYIMALLALSSGFSAIAEPTLYPKDLNVLSQVNNSTTSNIIADGADSKTVWVMPPNVATATVSGLNTLTANMGFCAEMRDEQTYSRDLAADIRKLEAKRVAQQDQLQKLQSRADQLNEDAEKYAADNNLQELADLDQRISDLQMRLEQLYKDANACNSSTTDCSGIQEEIKDSNAARAQMLTQRNTIAQKNTNVVLAYTSKKHLADAAQRTADNAKKAYTDLMGQIIGVQEQFRKAYASFGQMEGARAGIRYTSDWDKNVDSLRKGNPGLNFSKIATQNATLMTVLTGVQDVDPTGAIKSIEVAGNVKNGAASFAAYPENLSANVVLSLIGACPMAHPDYFDLKQDDVKDIQYGLIITYDYQTLFTVKATVSYDYYKMYQKIVSSGSSGGLFSSRSWSNVEEKNFFKDSFNVVWDDSENTMPQTEKDAREQEMRHSVLSRLATMALPQSPNPAGLIAASSPPTHGAVVAADELMKVCPGNVYCMGTAAVLTVLDAIFGSSSSSSSYTNIQQGTITDNYAQTQKITKSWITTYL